MKRILSRRLAYTYIAVIVSVIVFSAAAFYRYNVYQLLENGKANLEQFGSDTMAQMDTQFKALDVVSIELATNFELINSLDRIVTEKSTDQKDFDAVKAIVVKNYVNKVNIHRISIFTIYGDLFTTGNTDATAEEVKNNIFKSGWYGDIVVESGRRIYLAPELDMWDKDSGTKVISLIKAIRNGNKVIGYIEVQQKVDVIRNICINEWNNTNLSIAITNSQEDIFYTNITRADTKEYIKEIIAKTSKNSDRVVVTDKELVNVTDSNYTEFKAYLILEKTVLFKSIRVIFIYLAIFALIMILLSAVFVTIVTKKLTKPITLFVRKMEKLDLNNLKEPFSGGGRDYETEVLNRAFAEMKNRLTDSIVKQKVMESIQTKTLFNILQSEIGPHFLYNSLGSIASLCELGENEEAADACYSLSEILRYASDYETTVVTIYDEIENMKSYLALMKSRYRQRLDYTIEMDEATFSVMIPKLTFQPLVENAIKYSLIENECVFIHVTAQIQGSYLDVTVSDNGCGMSEEKKAEINRIISDTDKNMENSEIKSKIKFGAMGLIGTLLRLKLFFEDRFTYRIDDNEPTGTNIVIRIDLNRENTETGGEWNHVPDINH